MYRHLKDYLTWFPKDYLKSYKGPTYRAINDFHKLGDIWGLFMGLHSGLLKSYLGVA
jgi:hypothetical protein